MFHLWIVKMATKSSKGGGLGPMIPAFISHGTFSNKLKTLLPLASATLSLFKTLGNEFLQPFVFAGHYGAGLGTSKIGLVSRY